MEPAKRNTLMAAAALGLGVVALALAIRAGIGKPVEAAPAGVEAAQLARLEESSRNLAGKLVALRERLDRAESQLGAVAASKTDADSMRGIVNDIMREAFLQERGRAKLGAHEVPVPIVEVVNKMVPGIVLKNAELRRNDERTYYDLQGGLGDRAYKFRIAADGEVIEAELPPEMAPETVVASVTKNIPNARIGDLEKKRRDGREVFEAEVRVGEDEYELTIGTDGTLLEGELPVKAAPAPVLQAAQKMADGLEFRALKFENGNGQPRYRFEGRIDRDGYEIDIAATGQVLGMRMPTSRVPKIVTDAALKAAPGVRFGRTTQCKLEDNRKVYAITGRLNDGEVQVRVAEAGEVIDVKTLRAQNEGKGDGGMGAKPPRENAAREVF